MLCHWSFLFLGVGVLLLLREDFTKIPNIEVEVACTHDRARYVDDDLRRSQVSRWIACRCNRNFLLM